MAIVSIELFKKHVHADDFCEDDQYLEYLLQSAEEYVVKATNRSVDELVLLGDGQFPAALTHAVLLVAGHWYNQREAVSGVQMQEVPYTVQALIKQYRKLVTDKSTTV